MHIGAATCRSWTTPRPRLPDEASSKTTSSGERRRACSTSSETGPCRTVTAKPQRSMIAATAGREPTSSHTAPTRFRWNVTATDDLALT